MSRTQIIALFKEEQKSKWTLYANNNGSHREIVVDYYSFEDGDILRKYDFFDLDINGEGYYDIVTIVKKDEERIDILISRRMFYRGEFI